MSYKLNPFTGKLDLAGGNIQTSGDFKLNTVFTGTIYEYTYGSASNSGEFRLSSTLANGVYTSRRLDFNPTDANGVSMVLPTANTSIWISGDGVTYNEIDITYVNVYNNENRVNLDLTGNNPDIYLDLGISTGDSFYWSLTDPAGSPVALADGDVVQYNAAAGKFKPTQLSQNPLEWTLTANGTSDYIFAGPGFAGTETDPTIYVVRGQTYKFTNSMGAHPFQIQSTSGTSGTAYSDGITNNAVSNGTLTWEVRMDAPSTLYYQCTSHADMNGTIRVLDEGQPGGTSLPAAQDGEALIYENGTWVAGPVIGGVNYFTGAGDQYINDVALLMNFEGTDGTQVFTDSSPNNLTLTPNGSASNLKISTTQFKYGSSSGYFFMTYLTASSAIAFNSDPFTVEAWIYRVDGQSYSSSSGWTYGPMEGDIYSARPGITFKITGSNQLQFFRGNVATPVITTTTTIPMQTWTHVAVTRDSNDVITLWIDGVASATQTYVDTNGVGYNLGAGGTPAIGRRNGSSTSYFFGYIDDLRVTPGVCRYTADFTPPTAQLSSQLPTQTTIPSTTSRSEVSGATASIADGASDNVTITDTGKAGQLLSIQTSAAAWVTVYTSQAARTADVSRTETTDPTPGSGVIAEAITTGAQTVILTPGNTFFNDESTPVSELYLKVVNKSGASAAITTTLKVIPSEV